MMYFYDPTYIFVIVGALIGTIASALMQHTYSKYAEIYSKRNISANEVAKEILQKNGIYDVSIGTVEGTLTDHYAPKIKKLCLSNSTYNSTSIAAIGVASHECGHALQDDKRYAPLVFSMYVTPIVSYASRLSFPIIIASMFLGLMRLFNIGIMLFFITLLYQILTLPIEFNASKRAIESLENYNILDEEEIIGAKKVLNAAAMTYVAAAFSTLLQLLRFVLLSNRRRD
ncbi:MAG: zinc metallopeptidase [Eubacteriales bacterium]|nr:zinc metallopeptidase [Eubacteriales bacterium]